MTDEGRLSRGKENYEAKKFLNNSETLAYIDTIPKEVPEEVPKEVPEDKPKEKKDGKPNKRNS